MTTAVVFAYHNVGVRCLKALIGRGVNVALVVTHQDNPNENIWFDSVAAVAHEYGLPTITPEDPNSAEVLAQIAAARPDFLFSFYYRKMLKAPLLAIPSRGAFNMHGSLLPKYRGRVPINWAILHGETETGATLHRMNVKPDNGPIIDQMAVPILPDDCAAEVFGKVLVAAEMVLWRSLPALMDGSAQAHEQDLSLGGYFGGRGPEDGRIDRTQSAAQLHNFVRALSHPYPGAFSDTKAGRLILWKTLKAPVETAKHHQAQACLLLNNGILYLEASDGHRLQILDATLDEEPLNAATFAARFGERASLLI